MNSNLENPFNKMAPERLHYVLTALPDHLASSKQVEKLIIIISYFFFMQNKVQIYGTQALIEDYELALKSNLIMDIDERNQLKQIQESLRLSQHILDKDSEQLATQLLGRL